MVSHESKECLTICLLRQSSTNKDFHLYSSLKGEFNHFMDKEGNRIVDTHNMQQEWESPKTSEKFDTERSGGSQVHR